MVWSSSWDVHKNLSFGNRGLLVLKTNGVTIQVAVSEVILYAPSSSSPTVEY